MKRSLIALLVFSAFTFLHHRASAQTPCGGAGSITSRFSGAVTGQNWTRQDTTPAANALYITVVGFTPIQTQVPPFGELCVSPDFLIIGYTTSSGVANGSIFVPAVPSYSGIVFYSQTFVDVNGTWQNTTRQNSYIVSLALKRAGSATLSASQEVALAPFDKVLVRKGNNIYQADLLSTAAPTNSYFQMGALSMDVAHYPSGDNAIYIAYQDPFPYLWGNVRQSNQHPAAVLGTPYILGDFPNASTGDGWISKIAIDHNIAQYTPRGTVFYDSHEQHFFWSDTYNPNPNNGTIGTLIDALTIRSVNGNLLPLITELEENPLNTEMLTFDAASGNLFKINSQINYFIQAVLTKNQITAYTGQTQVDLRAVGTNGLGLNFFYDRTSGAFYAANANRELTTLATDAQIQVVSQSASPQIEDMAFRAVAPRGSFIMIDNAGALIEALL